MGNVRGTRTLNSKWDFKRIVAIFVLMAIFVVSVCFIRFGLVEKSESSATSHFVRVEFYSNHLIFKFFEIHQSDCFVKK